MTNKQNLSCMELEELSTNELLTIEGGGSWLEAATIGVGIDIIAGPGVAAAWAVGVLVGYATK
jgi:hypothetical protein